MEFLQTENIWTNLVALTSDTAFDTNISLLGACLLEVKTNEPKKAINIRESPIWQSMRAYLQYARLAETSGCRLPNVYLDEPDRVMTHHWGTLERWYDGDPRECFSPGHSSQLNHWAISALRFQDGVEDMPEYSDAHTTMLSLAASSGLVQYLKDKWAKGAMAITTAQVQQVMITTISSHACNFREKTSIPSNDSLSKFVQDDGTVPSETYVKIARFLFQHDVHTRGNMMSLSKIWLLALDRTYLLDDYAQGYWNTSFEDEIFLWTRMLKIIISSGVDPNARIEVGSRPGVHQHSALSVISRLFTQLPARSMTPPAVHAAREQIQSLLKVRGALEREWFHGKLVKGPPENPHTSNSLSAENNVIKPSDGGKKSIRSRINLNAIIRQ